MTSITYNSTSELVWRLELQLKISQYLEKGLILVESTYSGLTRKNLLGHYADWKACPQS